MDGKRAGARLESVTKADVRGFRDAIRAAMKDGTDETPLLPKLHDCHIGGGHGLSSQFLAVMKLAMVDRGTTRQHSELARAQHARGFHSLRHSLTSTLANLDVSAEIRRRITGHESAAVHSDYTHHERETLARAVDSSDLKREHLRPFSALHRLAVETGDV